MNLIDLLVNVFKEEMVKVFEREKREDGRCGRPNYMKQTVLGCRWRAFWGVVIIMKNSFPRIFKILAYAIADHRTKKHGENKTKTMRKLTRSMLNSDSINAKAGVFWD